MAVLVDTQEEPGRWVDATWDRFAVGELQNLHGMFIGVFEVESLDAARVFVPSGRRCGPEEACSTLFLP